MAAGLGFKEFTTGDVLTADDANGYLASQVVMVFADAAARTAAITTPEEGMISFLKDTNSTQFYTGAAWETIGAAGGGKVLQVVQGLLATTASTSSTSYTDTGLEVTITPAAATSKVLVLATVPGSLLDGDFGGGFSLFNGATNLIVPTSPSNRYATFAHLPGAITNIKFSMFSYACNFLDSPATTSATTYKVRFKATNAARVIYVNRTEFDQDADHQPRGTAQIIAMEIGA